MLPTVKLRGQINSPNGAPLSSRPILFSLSTPEIYEGIVIESFNTSTDNTGKFEVDIFPNELGKNGSHYNISWVTTDATGIRREARYKAVVPNADSNLHEVISLPTFPPSPVGGGGWDEPRVVGLESEVAGLSTRVEALEQTVIDGGGWQEARVDAIEAGLVDTGNQLSSHDGRLGALEAGGGSFDEERIANIESTVNELDGRINAAETDINALQGVATDHETTLTEQNARLEDLESREVRLSTKSTGVLYANGQTLQDTEPTATTSAILTAGSTPTSKDYTYTSQVDDVISPLALYDVRFKVLGMDNRTFTFKADYYIGATLISHGETIVQGTPMAFVGIPMNTNLLDVSAPLSAGEQLRLAISVTRSGASTQNITLESSPTAPFAFTRNGGSVQSNNVFDVWNGDLQSQSWINNDIASRLAALETPSTILADRLDGGI